MLRACGSPGAEIAWRVQPRGPRSWPEPHDLDLDDRAGRQKYLLLMDDVLLRVRAGTLAPGDRLPSLNEACAAHRLARATVVKAYATLARMGVVRRVHGKGHFVRAGALRALGLVEGNPGPADPTPLANDPGATREDAAAAPRGQLQVYTGDGKGKTTAALGLVARAVGAGLRVHVVQFIKSMAYAELATLGRLGVPVTQFGRGCFIRGEPTDDDRACAAAGLEFVRGLFAEDALDLLVLDEVNVAVGLGLVEAEVVLELAQARPPRLELVCTGRYAPPALLDAADLVTEMVKVRHYYDRGLQARDGIER